MKLKCTSCSLYKVNSEFTKQATTRGYRYSCKQCEREYQRARPEYRKNAKLKLRYGINLEIYNEMFKKQNGLCAICGTEGKLVVDHDHSTGTVRELLHQSCNFALGGIKENFNFALGLAKYIQKYKEII